MAVNPIPEGMHTVSPYLAVDDAAAAIDFYVRAFGAKELSRMPAPDGKIGHASIQIGDSIVMFADPFPQATARPPKELGGTSVSLMMYVEDADAVFKQAVDAGATPQMEPDDMFWGDRLAQVGDPFGHSWQIATHKEDLSDEEVAERGRKFMAGMT
jgi:uncharacterized glyoxalase superfamily protein PhnB